VTNLIERPVNRHAQIVFSLTAVLWAVLVGTVIVEFDLARSSGNPGLQPVLAIPVVIACVAAAATIMRAAVVLWCTCTLFAVYMLLTGFTVGGLYSPAVLADMLAAVGLSNDLRRLKAPDPN
jgi:hypothetical protein